MSLPTSIKPYLLTFFFFALFLWSTDVLWQCCGYCPFICETGPLISQRSQPQQAHLAAAPQRLTETDATILRNISGSQLLTPSFNRPQEEFNKRKHIRSCSPLEKLDKTKFTRSFSYFKHNLRPPEEYSHRKQKHLPLLGSSVSVPARYSVPQEKDTDESISN